MGMFTGSSSRCLSSSVVVMAVLPLFVALSVLSGEVETFEKQTVAKIEETEKQFSSFVEQLEKLFSSEVEGIEKDFEVVLTGMESGRGNKGKLRDRAKKLHTRILTLQKEVEKLKATAEFGSSPWKPEAPGTRGTKTH